jgi:hypothetical protein
VRAAITNSVVQAGWYGVYVGVPAGFNAEDVVIAGNVLSSAGPEATIRFEHTIRSATIGNRLSNGSKHNYRVHGDSDVNWAARNTLIETGAMIGSLVADHLGREWFDDNVFYHRAPSLFEYGGIETLTARGNVVYSTVWDCFFCNSVPEGWTIENNVAMPYVEPPQE